MRIRIALATAMAATFIMGSTMSLSHNIASASTGATQHHTIHDTLTAYHQPIPAGGHQATKKPLPSVLMTTDQRLLAPHRVAKGAAATTVAASTPAPAPVPPPPPPPTDATSTTTADWQCIRVHESGDEYNDPTRPSGAYGILASTWRSFGYGGWPYEAAPAVQDALALRLYNEYGWQPWSTRDVCGL